MKRWDFSFLSPRATLAFVALAAAISLPTIAVHAQGAPKAGGSTSGGKPSGSGGTTPSSSNAGGSSVSPSDRPKTNPIPSPSPAPSSSPSTPVIIVNPAPQYEPTYIAPGVAPYYAPAPNAPVTIIKKEAQPPRERPAAPSPSPASTNASILFQVIQQKGNLTRYMIVDAQARTVSIVRVKLPVEPDDVAEVVCESVAPYGVKKP